MPARLWLWIVYMFDIIESRINLRWRRFLWVFGIIPEREVWDLDCTLAGWLAPRLRKLADTTHGWPDNEFADMKDYKFHLRDLATQLDKYVGGVGEDERSFDKAVTHIRTELGRMFPMLWD